MNRILVRRDRHPLRRARLAAALAWMLVPGALFLCTASAGAQAVGGTVTSAEGSRPLPGVSVALKGTNVGTLTDAAGRYSLTVNSLASDTLVFSSIGFSRREIPVDNRASIDVIMVPQAIALEELVVVGYGTQQRRDVTGAVSSVDAEEIAAVATPSVTQALAGPRMAARAEACIEQCFARGDVGGALGADREGRNFAVGGDFLENSIHGASSPLWRLE